jgi:hypothetical protein
MADRARLGGLRIVRIDNIEKVQDALGSRAMTIRELGMTGLARNTILSALTFLGAERLDGMPARYRLPKVSKKTTGKLRIADPTITKAERRVQVELIDTEGIANRWNMARLTFAQTVGDLVIDPHANPKELADSFARAARTLASTAYAVQEAAQHETAE